MDAERDIYKVGYNDGSGSEHSEVDPREEWEGLPGVQRVFKVIFIVTDPIRGRWFAWLI